jgi:hypothetical protein
MYFSLPPFSTKYSSILSHLILPSISWSTSQSCCSQNSYIIPFWESYVYWTVHHLDSRIKRDQLDVTCFFVSLFNAQHVSDVNTSILRSLRLICRVISWVVLPWYDVCWCYGVVRLGWCGIRMQAEALLSSPNHNVTPTHIVPQQYNPWNNSTSKSQAPEDGCTNIRNMLSIK